MTNEHNSRMQHVDSEQLKPLDLTKGSDVICEKAELGGIESEVCSLDRADHCSAKGRIEWNAHFIIRRFFSTQSQENVERSSILDHNDHSCPLYCLPFQFRSCKTPEILQIRTFQLLP